MKSSAPVDDLKEEAGLFCRYLVGDAINDPAADQYAALIKRYRPLPRSDQKLLDFARKHPFSVGYIDAGAALIRPESEVRRRIYCMFAILEAQPEYSHKFLPESHRAAYSLVVGAVGIRAIIRCMFGILLIKSLRA